MSRLPTSRRGYTLIELMLVITLASMVLGSVGVLMQSVWRANRGMQGHRDMVRSIQRLSTQFRDDVHIAASVEAAGEKLTIAMPNDRVATYHFENQAVERTVESAGQMARHESFPLPPHATVAFAADPQGERGLASLQLTYPLGAIQPELADRRTLTIEAAHGLTANGEN